MFIRVKTADGENNVQVAQIRNFVPTNDKKGTVLILVDGDEIETIESNRVTRNLIGEALTGVTGAEAA